MEHITLKQMLEELVNSILNNEFPFQYYYKNEDGFQTITEIDLLNRIKTQDDDFTEFEWELEESNLYKGKGAKHG